MQYAILQYSSLHLAGCPMRLTSCPMRLKKFPENPESPEDPEAPKDKGAPDNSDAPFNDGKCARKNCLPHVFFTLPSSPESCGRRSCSAAGPSSEPRRRAPRPRWDKPS